MEQADLKKMFDEFNPTNKPGYFEVNEWDKQIDQWKFYRDLIKSSNGLDIKYWLRNDDGYLPNFLNQEKKFGSAKSGSYEQIMIYRFRDADDDRKEELGFDRRNKYYDGYKVEKESEKYFDDIKSVEPDYNSKIKPLLEKIVNASKLEEIFEIEQNDQNYKAFVNKQILNKMIVLCSVMDGSSYKNSFVWFFNDKDISRFADLLDINYDPKKDYFLEKNHEIYEQMRHAVGLPDLPEKKDLIKLYSFMLYLRNPIYNVDEFINFNNINIIFNGAPGTGKTFGVNKAIEELHNIDSKRYKDARYIQFHPAFTYQDFIEGIKPLGIVNGNLDLQVVNGCFKQFCIKVKEENEKFFKDNNCENDEFGRPKNINEWPHYYFIVDEINRGNLSNLFGETFTLLEADYRDYDFSGKYDKKTTSLVNTSLANVISKVQDESLVYKKIGDVVYFGIPFNIHFIGMMNDVDRSIDAFDLALRRRFKWIPKYCNYEVINNELLSLGYKEGDVDEYIESCKNLNNFICDVSNKSEGLKLGKNYEIGHAFFLKIKNVQGKKIVTKNKKEEVFTSYIEGTLKEYIRQVADNNKVDEWVEKAKAAFGI